jgi:hypothetical protein
MPQLEPRNPFYLLLLLASLLFVVTALAYGVVPVLEEKATAAGQPPPPSPLRGALRDNGAKWLLYELAAMAVFAVLSMGLDRVRSLKKERAADNRRPQAGSPSD